MKMKNIGKGLGYKFFVRGLVFCLMIFGLIGGVYAAENNLTLISHYSGTRLAPTKAIKKGIVDNFFPQSNGRGRKRNSTSQGQKEEAK